MSYNIFRNVGYLLEPVLSDLVETEKHANSFVAYCTWVLFKHHYSMVWAPYLLRLLARLLLVSPVDYIRNWGLTLLSVTNILSHMLFPLLLHLQYVGTVSMSHGICKPARGIFPYVRCPSNASTPVGVPSISQTNYTFQLAHLCLDWLNRVVPELHERVFQSGDWPNRCHIFFGVPMFNNQGHPNFSHGI